VEVVEVGVEGQEGKTWAFGDEVVEAAEVAEVEGAAEVVEVVEAVLQGSALCSAHFDHGPLADVCNLQAHTNCGYQYHDPQ
jgi:hypothetical protein